MGGDHVHVPRRLQLVVELDFLHSGGRVWCIIHDKPLLRGHVSCHQ